MNLEQQKFQKIPNEVRSLLRVFDKNKIYFTKFGNTEYAGHIFYDNKDEVFVFKTEREGMTKQFGLGIAKKLAETGQTRDIWIQ